MLQVSLFAALEFGIVRPSASLVTVVLPPFCTTVDDLAVVYRVIERFLEWR